MECGQYVYHILLCHLVHSVFTTTLLRNIRETSFERKQEQDSVQSQADGLHNVNANSLKNSMTADHAAAGESTEQKRLHAGKEPSTTDLQNLVQHLQAQLKESQLIHVHTRSIINVLQEKQDLLEDNLSILKDDILSLNKQHNNQREEIRQLRSLLDDNSWALANIRSTQDQTVKDLSTLKQHQNLYNATAVGFNSALSNNVLEVRNHNKHMHQFRDELDHVKQQMGSDADLIQHLQKDVKYLLSKFKSEVYDRYRSNEVMALGGRQEFDTIATNNIVESVDRDLSPVHQISATNIQVLEKAVSDLTQRLPHYDIELSVLRQAVSNVTQRVSDIHSGSSVEMNELFTYITELRRTVERHTKHILHLEERYNITYAIKPSYLENKIQEEQMMVVMVEFLEHHSEKIRILERIFRQQNSTNYEQLKMIRLELAELKQFIMTSNKNRSERADRSKLSLSTIQEMVNELQDLSRSTEIRLQKTEIQILNSSLLECKEAYKILRDQSKVKDVNDLMVNINLTIKNHDESIGRLDNQMLKLQDNLDKKADDIGFLLSQTKHTRHVPSKINVLEQEVENLLTQLKSDCQELWKSNKITEDGSYLIKFPGSEHSTRTFCQFSDDGVWTLIQKRTDDMLSFNRPWNEYKMGFGDPEDNFWIGNENLYFATNSAQTYSLQLDMWDTSGNYWYAHYATFRIQAENTFYRLELGAYSGNATDAFGYSNLSAFSTTDRDNDVSTTHCAQFYQSGWWYKHCHYGNLNGRYLSGTVWFNQKLEDWLQLKQTVMKIRRSNSVT